MYDGISYLFCCFDEIHGLLNSLISISSRRIQVILMKSPTEAITLAKDHYQYIFTHNVKNNILGSSQNFSPFI